MNATPGNVPRQQETEFNGELQQFAGPVFAPDNPQIEPRVRKGRPIVQTNPSAKQSSDENTTGDSA